LTDWAQIFTVAWYWGLLKKNYGLSIVAPSLSFEINKKLSIFSGVFHYMLPLSKPNEIYVIIIWTLKFLSLGITAWPVYIWGQEKLISMTSLFACFLWLLHKFIKILQIFRYFFIFPIFMTVSNILVENSVMETGPGPQF
jgi:hypothetical protein